MSLLRGRDRGGRDRGWVGQEGWGSPLCLRMPTGSLERASLRQWGASLSVTGAEGPVRGLLPRALPGGDPGAPGQQV